jgi:hypothetical protein|tara:strand:- start:862 stop:1527 length:666 start_codon:yes stop_codon:yes gene_type:complete
MFYDTIKKEIGKRLGDPLLDKYRALIGTAFAETVGNMILEKEYTANDIQNDPELPYPLFVTKYYSVIDSNSGVRKFTLPSDLFMVLDISFSGEFSNLNPSIPHYRPTLREISKNTHRRMVTEDTLKPAAYEIFYLIDNYNIIFYKSNEWEVGMGEVVILLFYLKSPSNEVWQNINSTYHNPASIFPGLDLERDVGLSPQFILKAINKTVSLLAGSSEKGES